MYVYNEVITLAFSWVKFGGTSSRSCDTHRHDVRFLLRFG
jgi:hypothetical protein